MGNLRSLSGFWVINVLVLLIAACGGGGGGGNNPEQNVELIELTGTVNGLEGTVVLQNGTESVAVSQNGSVTIEASVPVGSEYDVQVAKHPVGQICSVSNGKGTTGSENVSVSVGCGTAKYFALEDRDHGLELWHTNGTAAGTQMVMDYTPGIPSTSPINPMVVGETLFFYGFDQDSHIVLYASDGSVEGTRVVSKIFGEAPYIYYEYILVELEMLMQNSLAVIGDKVYFFRNLNQGEVELLESDGTEAGTKVIHTSNYVGDGNFDIYVLTNTLTNLNGKLVFAAIEGEGAFPLKVFDGTEVTDLGVDTVSGSSRYSYLHSDGSKLVFQRRIQEDDDEYQIWITDGSSENTKKLVGFLNTNYKLFLSSLQGNDFYFFEDGEPDTIKKINLTSGEVETHFSVGMSDYLDLYDIFVFKNELYLIGYFYNASEGSRYADGIYKVNAENEIEEIQKGFTNIFANGVFNQQLIFSDQLFFMVFEETEREEPIEQKTSALPAGEEVGKIKLLSYSGSGDPALLEEFTVENDRFDAGFGNLFEVGGQLGFFAETLEFGMEPFITDGTPGSAVMIKDVNTATDGLYYIDILPLTNGVVNYSRPYGDRIYTGITPQSVETLSFSADSNARIRGEGATLSGTTYFIVEEEIDSEEAWGIFGTDGTATGTQRLAIAADSTEAGFGEIIELVAYKGELFARVDEGGGFQNLLRITFDNTDPNLVRLSNVYDSGTYSFNYLAVSDAVGIVLLGQDDGIGTLFLLAGENLTPSSFTSSDDEVSFNSLASPQFIGEDIYFWGIPTGQSNQELYKLTTQNNLVERITSGISARYSSKEVFDLGSELVVRVYSDFYSLDESGQHTFLFNAYYWQNEFAQLGDSIYFAGSEQSDSEPDLGYELWRYSGGTIELVKDIFSGEQDSRPQRMFPIGDRIIFTAANAKNGRELWVTDGTEAGTQILKDIKPGYFSSLPEQLTTVDGQTYYFHADDHLHGREIWKTDGTAAGTQLVNDANTNGAGSWLNFFGGGCWGPVSTAVSAVKPSC